MFWYCGQLQAGDTLALASDDPGLLYGATLFSTVRVYRQSLSHPLTAWAAHCERLARGVDGLDWQPPDWQRLQAGAQALCDRYPVLRVVLFPDGREWIVGRPLPSDLNRQQQQGIAARLAQRGCTRALPQLKTGNYLPAWWARAQAQKQGAGEAILVDGQGHWLETATGNLWGWQGGCWWTPADAGSLLPGVARSQLWAWLQQQQWPVGQCQWDGAFIEGLQALAHTNSVVEVVPIRAVEGSERQLSFDPQHPALAPLRQYFSHSERAR